MAGIVKRSLSLALTLMLPLVAVAGDPTRPPAGWASSAESTDQGGGDSSRLVLQSVLLPERGRPVAVIGGKTVALGGKVGELTLVRLTEREAVLRGSDGLMQLFLTPDVEKQIISPQTRTAGKSGKVKEAR